MSMPFHAANRVRMIRAADTVTGSSGLNSPLPLPAAQVEGGVAAIKMGNRDIGSCLTRRIITNAAVVIHIEYAFIKIGHTAAVVFTGIPCDGGVVLHCKRAVIVTHAATFIIDDCGVAAHGEYRNVTVFISAVNIYAAAVGRVGIMTAHAACDGAGLALTAILKG